MCQGLLNGLPEVISAYLAGSVKIDSPGIWVVVQRVNFFFNYRRLLDHLTILVLSGGRGLNNPPLILAVGPLVLTVVNYIIVHAEAGGFEPPRRSSRSLAFKASAVVQNSACTSIYVRPQRIELCPLPYKSSAVKPFGPRRRECERSDLNRRVTGYPFNSLSERGDTLACAPCGAVVQRPGIGVLTGTFSTGGFEGAFGAGTGLPFDITYLLV